MKLMDTVEVLTEMAAKKTCEHCGKTMAANHYWYKGGWKCKKAKSEGDAPAKKEAAPAKTSGKETTTQEIERHRKMDPHHEERKNYKSHVSNAGAAKGIEPLLKKQKATEENE